MKKRLASVISLVLLVVSCGCARAETDIMEELHNIAEQAAIENDPGIIRETLASLGCQMDLDAVEDIDSGSLYDAIMEKCEQEYGSYYGWTVARRYRFDSLMVLLGQLPYCTNLDPASDIMDQEAALDAAISEIVERYGAAYDTSDFCAAVSYCAVEDGSAQGMWRFGIEFSSGDIFSVHVLRGDVTHCAHEKRAGSLELEYNKLCEERGAFFRWSLLDKVEYANSLPDKLRMAQAKDEGNMSYDELAAISRYGFTLPGIDDLPQEEARLIALQGVQAKYNLPEDWSVHGEIFYSLFSPRAGENVWRVIIWNTGEDAFPSGVVELNAQSGEILKIEKNGTKPNEFMPYLDRI